MTTVLKATNDTAVAVLGSVGTIANQIGNTVNTVSKSLDMLDMFVSTAHTKQRLRTAVELSTYTDELLEESAMENSKRQQLHVKELEADPQLKSLYKDNEAKLRAVLEALNRPAAE